MLTARQKKFTTLTPENVVDFLLTFKVKTAIHLPDQHNWDEDVPMCFTPAQWAKRKTVTVQTVDQNNFELYDLSYVLGPKGDTSQVIVPPKKIVKRKVVQIGKDFFDPKVIATAEELTYIDVPEDVLAALDTRIPYHGLRIMADRLEIGCQSYKWSWWTKKANRDAKIEANSYYPYYLNYETKAYRKSILDAIVAGRDRLIEKVTG